MKDEILERWNTMTFDERDNVLNKFNFNELGPILKSEKVRTYIKENYMKPKSKLLRRES
jgi:hypothetical protein